MSRISGKHLFHESVIQVDEAATNSFYRKCTLKDGVLTVNGKEYVFHKANGEYEW